MEIQDKLAHLAIYLPMDRLIRKTELSFRYIPENVTHALPSIVISGDGLTLARILLVTNHYLCDVVMTDEPVSFDLIAKGTIVNYRFRIWTHAIKDGDEVKASYDVGQVQLLHGLTGFRTELDYAGNDRDAWLARVLEAIPISSILQRPDTPS